MPLTCDDIKARVDLGSLVERELGEPVKASGAWRLYFCPFHENTRTPALGVNVETGTFKCFSCQKHGDLFTWRMLTHGEDFKRAITYFRERLGRGNGQVLPVRPRKKPDPFDRPPPEQWQARGRKFVRYAQEQLAGETGKPGREELARRNLDMETAAAWRIGYNPAWVKDDPEKWGIRKRDEKHVFWLPRGLVIPGFVGDELCYIKVRVFGSDLRPVSKDSGQAKYMQLAGSKGALYGAGKLSGKEGLLLAESELDGLLAWQEGRDLLDVASLGGAGKRLSSRWLPYLLPYQKIFVAYDMDRAGLRGAQTLGAMSNRLVPWPPPFGDLIEFKQRGGDLRRMMEEMIEALE